MASAPMARSFWLAALLPPVVLMLLLQFAWRAGSRCWCCCSNVAVLYVTMGFPSVQPLLHRYASGAAHGRAGSRVP